MTETSLRHSIDTLSEALAEHHPGERGRLLAEFARLLHARTPAEYFNRYPVENLEQGIRSMFEFVETSEPDAIAIRAGNPTWLESRGRGRTAIDVTASDQPFLVDTLRELVRVHGHVTKELFHPILSVRRDDSGRIVAVRPPAEGPPLVSFSHLEIDRALPPEELAALENEARSVFAEAQQVARDFFPMLEKLGAVTSRLRAEAEATRIRDEREELEEYAEFLEWLQRSNFVFLGYREYNIAGGAEGPIASVARGSGLGVLREETQSSLFEPRPLAALPADVRHRLSGPPVLTVYKTDYEARVLRRTRMDAVSVKKLDAGRRVCGEQRFLGLFTARALADLPADIPILRRKLDRILEKAGVVQGSHDYKEIFSIFCSLPKSELFATDVDALHDTILTVLENRDRLNVRVYYRLDELERGVSVMVLLPRGRFSVEVRQAIQELLAKRFSGTLVDYRLALTDEPQARLHFYFVTPPSAGAAPSLVELEAEVAALTRTWDERVEEALKRVYGVELGMELAQRYQGAFPPSYRAEETPETAAEDIGHLEAGLLEGRPYVVVGRGRSPRGPAVSEIKIFRSGEAFRLSQLMPILHHLGLEVWDERTHAIERKGERPDHLHVFRVLGPGGALIPAGERSSRLEEAIIQVLFGNVADDWLNSLVARIGMGWREVDLLRAYTAYFRQLEGTLRQRTAYGALCEHPQAAAALLELFEARFDPDSDEESRRSRQDAARKKLEAALEDVPGILEDQVLRGYENLILATVRTNYYQRGREGELPAALALKVRSADVTRMPEPRPLYETFVASRRLEGIHLRSGKVARGGIRWSDRVDDLRTEILGLMKAQRTKNALIVPVGAKGGFVLKDPPAGDDAADEAKRQYETFIGSLLDVTDNVAGGRIVPPRRTVVHDEPDPYLVVAADRGTAQLSDTANEIAKARSFWLEDAFASGGTSGYNHKTHGITARGAWECVKRHFRELGRDIQTDEFTAAGIGDMSGDVFGNAMLRSRKIRLLAAFNHRHIFLDPSPDPEISFQERERLFRMPRSSWADYDRETISEGGGVYERTAKSIPLSPQAGELLGIAQERVNGDELIRCILRMRVDLLWNGGIGTYIKGTAESALEVGDPSNDAVRVNAADAGARVIGEGGNLGVTQLGRIEFALKGGKINTDFIDNSGGVDLSDREVNLKIALNGAIKAGRLTRDERDQLLRQVASEVCERVVDDTYRQSAVLSLEEGRSADTLDQLRLLIGELESRGLLDRSVERVPEEAELLKLRETKMGLCRPQLAVLLAYAKIDAYQRVVDVLDTGGGELGRSLEDYFPRPVVERFGELIGSHPLRREIAATAAVNDCVNHMGLTFLHRLAYDTARPIHQVLRAYLKAARYASSRRFQGALDSLYRSGGEPPSTVYRQMREFGQAVEAMTRWLLRRAASSEELDALAAELGLDQELAEGPAPGEAGGGPEAARASLEEAADRRDRLLESARQGVFRLEALEIARRKGVSKREARRALEAASESLLAARIREESDRVVWLTASDWRMSASLEARLQDLVRMLAESVIDRAALPGGAGRGEESSLDAIDAAARELVPDDDRTRRRILGLLDSMRAREPASPSDLFVIVEDIDRLVRS